MHFHSHIYSQKTVVSFAVFIFLFCSSSLVLGQSKGLVKGRVFDKYDQLPIAEVIVAKANAVNKALSAADGEYLIELNEGSHNIYFTAKGYSTKYITGIIVKEGEVTWLNIFMSEDTTTATTNSSNVDSLKSTSSLDSTNRMSFSEAWKEELKSSQHQMLFNGQKIPSKAISPGIDKDLVAIMGRLNGVTVWQREPYSNQQFLIADGMGERYNQVRLNGQVMNSSDLFSKQYPFGFLPAEAIESVKIQSGGDASLPADYAGVNLDIKTKNIPDKNFVYLQVGTEVLTDSYSKNFYGDKLHSSERISLPVSERKLPDGFPSSRSQYPLSEKNPQEQSYLLGRLDNNLAANKSNSIPGTRILGGLGRKFRLKSGAQVGFTFYVQHQLQEIIDESTVQSSPDITYNPYPFTKNDKPLINAWSEEINYRFQSQLGAVFNSAVIFGKNKISLSTIFGNQFTDTYSGSNSIMKPDEDSLAAKAVRYIPTQRKYASLQFNGEHALGQTGKFRLDWQFAYSQLQQQNDDERNFLVRQSQADPSKFELATPQTIPLADRDNVSPAALDANLAAIFTNSARTWRTQKDKYFSGWANLSFPFKLFSQPQTFTGGVFMQTSFREHYSDLLLYQGRGYVAADSLIAPSRYYPGGVTVEEFYTKVISDAGTFSVVDINADNLGNYTGSANTGASFVQYIGKFTPWLFFKGGIRFESGSILVSTSEYHYYEGYKNAQIISIDENATVADYDLLPSAEIIVRPIKSLSVSASYYKTLNRPGIQELSSFRYYDAGMFMVKSGNPFLENSSINNFSAGLQWAASKGLTFSMNGFYKQIDNPIENVVSLYLGSKANYLSTPYNLPKATVYGIKGSILLPITKNPALWWSDVSVYASGVWTKSEVEAGPVRSVAVPLVAKHSLAGSPELTLNGGIVIQHAQWPQLSINYQKTSDYLLAVGSGLKVYGSDGDAVYAIPDYWVKGMEQLNVQLSYGLFRNSLQIIAGAQNILNSPYTVYQDLNGDKAFDEPMRISKTGANRGYYIDGTDNTVLNISNQKSFYVRLSFTIN